ncbi:MAG: hypothetical protein II786_07935 [Muribaculaceae bacterium]|nr:hypothetical protein [Muribaculaceae bacterium]
MKAIKYIGQVVASLIYTPIYTSIIYFAMTFAFLFAISLPTKWMVIVFIFFGGIIEVLIYVIQVLGLLPYAWIVKQNKTSLTISVGLCSMLVLYFIYCIWKVFLDFDTAGIITAVILSGLLLQFLFMSVVGIIGIGKDD